jgi:hypothetical protein
MHVLLSKLSHLLSLNVQKIIHYTMTDRNTLPDPLGIIHSCSFCYVQEIDPAFSRKLYHLSSGTSIKYRGSRVVEGASNGCAFFQVALSSLHAILNEHRHINDTASPLFRSENWTYELFFFLANKTGKFERAKGQWACAEGELPENIQFPTQKPAYYVLLAYPGTLSRYHFLV